MYEFTVFEAHYQQARTIVLFIVYGIPARVVAIAKNCYPLPTFKACYGRLSVGVAQLAVKLTVFISSVDFPQHVAGSKVFRVGDIQRKHALAAGAQGAHQNGFPAAADIGVTNVNLTINIKLMLIIWVSQLVKTAVQHGRDISKVFF